jgi:hypothetical protein
MNKRKRYSASKRMAALEARSVSEATKARRLRSSNSENTLARNYDLWVRTDKAFRGALDLSTQTCPEDEIILRAFKTHHLDWKNPVDWRRLLFILASAHYGDRLPSGRKQKWTEAKQLELLSTVTVSRKAYPKLSESRICAKLILDEPYKGLSAATLQKQLQYARDLMRDLLSNDLQDWLREEARRRGVEQTAEFEKRLIGRTRSDAARMLSGQSPRGRRPKCFAK